MSDIKNRYQVLINKILNVRKKQHFLNITNALAISLALFSLVFLFTAIIEYFASGDMSFRTTLFYLSISSVIFGSIIIFYKPLKQLFANNFISDIEHYSNKIGTHFIDLKDRLLNGVQLLKQSENNKEISKDLIYGAFDNLYTQAKDLDFNQVIDYKSKQKSIFIALLFLFISTLTLGINSNINNAFTRVINHDISYLPPIPFEIKIKNQNQNILRGEDLSLEIIGNGELPDKIDLFLKEGQQSNFDKYSLRKNTNNQYDFNIKSIKNNLSFFAQAQYLTQTTATDTGIVSIIDRPIIRNLSGKIIYPRYTGINSKKFDDNNADITALKGSTINLNLLSSKELDSAYFIFQSINNSSNTINSDKKLLMNTQSRKASTQYKIKNSGLYSFIIKDKLGQTNLDPIQYRIISIDDAYPSISLIQPRFDVQIDENAILPTKIYISDDFGFDKLYLNYKLSYSKYVPAEENFKKIEVPFVKDGLALEIPFVWDLNPLGISPEDRYQFYFEVFDNDIVSGPKSSRTKTLTLRLPSLEEAFKETQLAQNEIEKELDKVLKEADELKKDIDKLQHELRKNNKNKKLSWDEKKKANDISKKQQEIQEKMKDLSEKLSENTENMEKNNLLSQETLEKLKQLQDLMKQVATPEMMQKSQKLQNELEKMTPEQMQKALEQTKINDEKMRESIDRTLKMLKKMQAEQKTDEIQKRAKELAKQQEELKKETQKANENSQDKKSQEKKNQELAKNQENIKEDFEKLEKEINSLEEMMKNNEDMPKDMLDKAKKELDQNQTKQEMKNSENQLKKGDHKESQKNQSKAQQKLQDFANQMQQMKQQMMQNENQKMINELKQKLADLLKLSKKQEELKNQTQESSNNSTRLPEIQRNQADVQNALENLAKQMSELSKQSMAITPQMGEEIGNALNQMQKSQSQLSERQSRNSSASQQNSMTNMNKAASMMQASLSQMQGQGNGSCKNPGGQQPGGEGQGQGQSSGGPGMGFSQQLQKAAAQQQMISQSLQQMQQGQQGSKAGQGQGNGKGGKNGSDKESEFGRLKDQQGRAKKSVDKMIEEQKKFSNGGDKDKINELQEISKEMNEVMHDLESGSINPETLKRQEKILSRLLDVNQSVNERDKQKKRQAKSGQNINRQSPQLDLEALKNDKKALNDLLKKINQGYSKDYEILIRKYLEEIKDRNN